MPPVSKETMQARNDITTSKIFSQVFIVYAIQIAVAGFIIQFTDLFDEDKLDWHEVVESASKPEVDVMRILTMILTHILLQENINGGMSKMKFAMNQHWKFSDWKLAFLVGFMQWSMVFIVEVATCIVLIFKSDNVFDILANYVIVLVIADFGENFFSVNA